MSPANTNNPLLRVMLRSVPSLLTGSTTTHRLLLILHFSFFTNLPLSAQTQLGGDIDGEAAGDLSGNSVSLSADGRRAAIGAPGNDTDTGHVRVYQWNESMPGWAQLGGDIDGAAAGDLSGNSVSLSADGRRLAIGAPGHNGNGDLSGHVRVYEWRGSDTPPGWAQLGSDIDGEAADDGSGWFVSLSGDGRRVAIGAPGNDINGDFSGHVRVYEWSVRTADWEQAGNDIDGAAAGDGSGVSVSLSGDGRRAAIGAPGHGENEDSLGHVRVYQWDENLTEWAQLGGDIDGEGVINISGWSVSLSDDGHRVAIGAPGNDDNGNNAGQVRVYGWNGTTWAQLGEDIDGVAAGDQFGSSVSLSADGRRLAIGGSTNDDNKNNAGQVRVYGWNGTTWTQLGRNLNGDAAEDNSGWSVSLSGDGRRVAIGAPFDSTNGAISGRVRVYQNVNEAPAAIALSSSTIAENQPAGTVIGTLSTTDPDAGDTHTYTLSGADAAGFEIRAGEDTLRSTAPFDFETKDSYSITVTATDAGGLSVPQNFSITVVEEEPLSVSGDAASGKGIRMYPNPVKGHLCGDK